MTFTLLIMLLFESMMTFLKRSWKSYYALRCSVWQKFWKLTIVQELLVNWIYKIMSIFHS